MSEKAKVEIGWTYAYAGWVESRRGRKALILDQISDNLFLVRWPNGQEQMTSVWDLGEPVEPAVPGVDEPCLQCEGSKEVRVSWDDPTRKPCPNCGTV